MRSVGWINQASETTHTALSVLKAMSARRSAASLGWSTCFPASTSAQAPRKAPAQLLHWRAISNGSSSNALLRARPRDHSAYIKEIPWPILRRL